MLVQNAYLELGRRSSICYHWLFGSKRDISFLELCKFFFGLPCEFMAKPKIKKIYEHGQNIIVYFNDFVEPLYYPKEMDRHSLYQVISELFYENNWHYYEKMCTNVALDDVVVDCGAAEGLFSLQIARRCKKVYIIEPLPNFVDVLNLTFSQFENVEIIPVALSDSEGHCGMDSKDISSSLIISEPGGQIKVTTIDKLFYERNIPISYIKADIEGYEINMLKGAFMTIKKYKPCIAITTYHKSNHAEWIINYLKQIDEKYKIRLVGIEDKYGAPVMLHATFENQ